MELKTNTLYYGDNLEILRDFIPDNSIDLIYLDPPFNSKRDYNVIFKESGQESEAQIEAFTDTWSWGKETEKTYYDIIMHCPQNIANLIDSFCKFLGHSDVTAYLVMMTPRLRELHRVLKPTGSIYLHCDPSASHYLKVLMDQIFSKENFRNEVVWHKNSGGIGRTAFSKRHDTMLFYTKTKKYFYNGKAVGELREQNEGTFGGYFGTDANGRRYREVRKNGKIYKYFMDEPRNPEDVWEIPQIPERDTTERLGYPTQKPLKLLERIIKASSGKGDIVLDPFCGCGTAIITAQKLGRKWIGIDITHLAIGVIKRRLRDIFKDIKFEVVGEPRDLAGAKELAHQRDRYQFQWWALDLIGAQPMSDRKKGSDRGIDGLIPFIEEKNGLRRVIVQVKSGHVGPAQIRDLKGVVEREKGEIGVFITLEPATTEMQKEASVTGFYHSETWGKDYPKIQILTIEELLHGKKVEMPPQKEPFKKATPVKMENENLTLV